MSVMIVFTIIKVYFLLLQTVNVMSKPISIVTIRHKAFGENVELPLLYNGWKEVIDPFRDVTEPNAEYEWSGNYIIYAPKQRIKEVKRGFTCMTISPEVKLVPRKEAFKRYYEYAYRIPNSSFLVPIEVSNLDFSKVSHIELTAGVSVLTRITPYGGMNNIQFFTHDLYIFDILYQSVEVHIYLTKEPENPTLAPRLYFHQNMLFDSKHAANEETYEIENINGLVENIVIGGTAINRRYTADNLLGEHNNRIPKPVQLKIKDEDLTLSARELLDKYKEQAEIGYDTTTDIDELSSTLGTSHV